MISRIQITNTVNLSNKISRCMFSAIPKPFSDTKRIKPFTVLLQSIMYQHSTSSKKEDFADTIHNENIVWVDLEMTGLDPEKDHILEAACLVTDSHLNNVDEGMNLIIHQPPDVLQNMNDWSMKQHKESGLTRLCEESKLPLKEAEKLLLDYVKTWTSFNKCPMGGNTVYMDRFFLKKYMPEFEQHMHYRLVDVSSIKELCSRWYPDIYKQQPNKKEISKHRALEDIKMSIQELKFYKDKIFQTPETKKH